VSLAVNFTKNGINRAKWDYYEKIKNGSKGGRQKTVNDKAIHELAVQGKRSEDIAKELGISKSSVDHSEGWRKRKEADFNF
jgi:DNA-binding NarL/FixJ family response regulator